MEDELSAEFSLFGTPLKAIARRVALPRKLENNKRYLQVAFNGSLENALYVISRLPRDQRILIEAGTPFIKRYGSAGISALARKWGGYVVADMKITDGAAEEVAVAASAGAAGVTVLGSAPDATLLRFVKACRESGVEAFVDMLGVEDPLRVMMPLVRSPPDVVILHKGRDEETVRGRVIGYKHVKRVKSKFDVFISAAGGVGLKEAQSASFNGADIVVVNVVEPGQWWSGLKSDEDVAAMAQKFLATID